MQYNHIFIDLDRTLWDFESNSKETFIEIFTKHKLDRYCQFRDFFSEYRKINEKLWKEYRLGKITKEALSWQRFYKSIKLFGIDSIEEAKSMSYDYISISPTKTKLLPYSKNILQYLSAKYNLHIITNGFKEVQYLKIDNCGLSPFFTSIFTSEEVGCNKPHKDFFNFVIAKTKATKQESIVIGDDIEADIKGASNVCIDTIWFNPHKFTSEHRPTHEIQTLKEIENIL